MTYYLSATSNNGKTVTKPINAQKGSLYDFTITSAVEYDKNQFDYATEPASDNQIKFLMGNSLIREDTSTEPTGIVEIEHGTLNIEHSVYDLQGRKVNAAQKGVYIMNGKKVIK